jgi:hypothetical protein
MTGMHAASHDFLVKGGSCIASLVVELAYQMYLSSAYWGDNV